VAAKALRELLKRGESVNAWMSLARLSKARGWEPESVDAAKKALAVQPLSGTAIEFLNDVDRRLGDHAEVEKRCKALLEIDRADGEALSSLVGSLRARGQHDEALKLIDEAVARWPRRHGWKRNRADVLAALGRDADALAQLRAIEPLLPQDEGIPRKVGEILEVQGDAKGALASYRKSLAVEPFQPALWRAVTRLEGKEEDFAAGWEPDVKETLAAIPSTEELKKKYPKAVAVTVLDHSVVRVHPDGSSRNYVHMIYKVLDEKGVEKHADLPNMGETLQVRAILPDGTVTTPTGLRGRSFNIEGLVPGTVLDHRYVVSQRSAPKGYDGGTFWFQDTDIDDNPSPVLLSRWVVVTPEGMRIDGRKLNYAGEAKVETRDGWTATVWEQKDLPLLEAERNRPRNEEIFSHVDYSIPKTFEDAPWELFTQRADSRGSPMIDEALAKCVKPGMSDMDKLRAIHEFVNREITGDASSGSGATAVLLEKSGSRDLLFEAMARTAGIRYRLGRALAWNGSGRKLSEQDPDAFNGAFLWFEPKDAAPVPHFARLGHHAPFGLVPEPYRQSAAFLLDESGGILTRLPAGGLETDDSSDFRIRLSADPKVTSIEGTLRYRTPNGYGFKRTLVDMSGDDRKKFAENQFSSWFANPKLETWTLPKLEERGQPLDIVLKGTMSTYVEKQGESWIVTLGLPESNMARRYVDKADRQFDLVLQSRDDRRDEFTIDLGDAWDVSSLPEDHTAVHDVGVYSLTWRREGSVVRVRRERHFHPARYRPDEYKAFVAWCKAIDDAEDRKLELRKR
jgi:tetratricopeptide (TPR) repeat protein